MKRLFLWNKIVKHWNAVYLENPPALKICSPANIATFSDWDFSWSLQYDCFPGTTLTKNLAQKSRKRKSEGKHKRTRFPQSAVCTYFHFRRAAFSSLVKSRVGNIIAEASALRVNLNLDGASIDSSSHTHPSHSETSRLLTLSLSLGVPVPRPTQCMGDA